MKPMLAPPRHSRMPTCTRVIGACALVPAKDVASMVMATPARRRERRMKKSPESKKYDAGRQLNKAPLARRAPLYGTTSFVVPDLAERAMRYSPKQRPAEAGTCTLALSELSR